MNKKIFIAGAVLLVIVVGYLLKYNTSDYERWHGIPLPVLKPIWERKVDLEGTESIKISLITDTHVKSTGIERGDYENRYFKDTYIRVMEDFADSVERFVPDFAVHLGDLIEGSDAEEVEARTNIRLLTDGLLKNPVPFYWVIGNHDTRSLTREQFMDQLGIDYINKVFDRGPYRFIIWDLNYNSDSIPNTPETGDYIPGFATDQNIAWLEEQLITDQDIILFVHHSLIPDAVIDKNPIKNAADVRALLTKYNVRAVWNGHIEKRYEGEIDGVTYYSFPGSKKREEYPAAHYDVILSEGELDITMRYRDPETEEVVTEVFGSVSDAVQ